MTTFDLLRNDRSLLSFEQWSILSNVINSYDEKSPISNINKALARLSDYPSKMRFKMANDDYTYIISLPSVNVGPFINKLPEFKSLSLSDQATLIERNIRSVGNLGGTPILRETDIHKNPYYYSASLVAFGPKVVEHGLNILYQSETNVLLVKLFLPLMAFSTCSDSVNSKFSSNCEC
jgi:hypothetical protein